jgi:hypothetical protein
MNFANMRSSLTDVFTLLGIIQEINHAIMLISEEYNNTYPPVGPVSGLQK